jgi:hypothetical protein
VPWVLSYSTCAVLQVIRLVVACGHCGSIGGKLLSIDFLGYIFWISEYVVVSIYDAVKRGCFVISENFVVYFLGLLSYNCWYFDMVFLIYFSEYYVVIFRASFLVVFAFMAKSNIHVSCGRVCSGGGVVECCGCG